MPSNNNRLSSLFPSKRNTHLTSPAPATTSIQPPPPQTPHILLTGSTGALGTYILSSLLTSPLLPPTTKITCLNRSNPTTALARQRTSFTSRGLDLHPLNTAINPPNNHNESTTSAATATGRLQFLLFTPSDPHLGLKPTEYTSLQQTITTIIHSAWPVDFNRSFASFQPHIEGVRNLVRLGIGGQPPSSGGEEKGKETRRGGEERKVQFFFISSVSAVGRWGAVPGASESVPEEVVEDWRVAKMGYGQSKLVAERLVVEGARVGGGSRLEPRIVRVGQLSGPTEHREGVWKMEEWVPSLVKSSALALHSVPRELGPMEMVDWVGIDVAGRILVELVAHDLRGGDQVFKEHQKGFAGLLGGGKSESTVKVYHLANPKPVSWEKTLLPEVLAHFPNEGKDVKPVSFVEWVNALEKSLKQHQRSREMAAESGAKDQFYDRNPAAKLMTFFDELRDKATRFPQARAARLETKKTMEVSETLKGLNGVSPEDVRGFMEQWALDR